MKQEQFIAKKWRKQPMKETKNTNSNKPVFEVQMHRKNNKRMMAYQNARANLSTKKKSEENK